MGNERRTFVDKKCSGAFNICCPRDCVSRHNGGTAGAPLKRPRVDSALRALSSLRGLRGAPEVPPLCRETQSLGQHMLELSCEIATVGKNELNSPIRYTAVMYGGFQGELNWPTMMPRGACLGQL